MLNLDECGWTIVGVELGSVEYAWWEKHPFKFQKVRWVATGDRYTVVGYVN
jgi:hypothetical protein